MNKTSEITTKTERLARMLAEQNLGGVLLRGQHNFSWLTAGGSSMVDLSSETGTAALLVRRDGKRFVLANRIEMPRMLAEEVSEADFEPIEFPWEEERSSSTAVANRATALLEGSGGLASDYFTDATIPAIEQHVAQCRYELLPGELERFRQLGSDAGVALGEVARSVTPGQTEIQIAAQTQDTFAQRGMTSVVTLVAADERLKQFRHPVPTERIWKKILMIVVCARRGGLIASLTRIVCIGPVPDELEQRTRAAAQVDARMLAATRPGARGSDLYRVAADGYRAEGFDGEERLHHQGGAAGYRTRDWVAHPACTETVRVNQAFAWNPSITGTKVEETTVVLEDGFEVITSSPNWPSVSVTIDGRDYLLPGVLSR